MSYLEIQDLENVKAEEIGAVRKFQEFNATIMVGYGQNVNWPELVHNTTLVSDGALVTYITTMRERQNKINVLEDEDGLTSEDLLKASKVSISYDRNGSPVVFTVQDCLNFARVAKKVREYYTNLKEVAKIDAELASIDRKSMTKEERLAQQRVELERKRATLLGQKLGVTATEKTNTDISVPILTQE